MSDELSDMAEAFAGEFQTWLSHQTSDYIMLESIEVIGFEKEDYQLGGNPDAPCEPVILWVECNVEVSYDPAGDKANRSSRIFGVRVKENGRPQMMHQELQWLIDMAKLEAVSDNMGHYVLYALLNRAYWLKGDHENFKQCMNPAFYLSDLAMAIMEKDIDLAQFKEKEEKDEPK